MTIVNDSNLRDRMMSALSDDILRRWYPLVVDRECGGYFTNISADWKVGPEQEKMIVSQARHVWATSKFAAFFQRKEFYREISMHGFTFLKDTMWDADFGGYYQILDRKGGMSASQGWRSEKRAYGNAFAVYALAALYELTGDAAVLAEAQKAFRWIEDHCFDPVHGGYFQFLTREGKHFDRSDSYKTIASDANELGFKDQNSSIHLLEAYTQLYHVWKDPGLRKQLESLLILIRDTMVHPLGYLQLFFHPDWTPVSFRDGDEATRKANFGLDHVSFGHDYETAFLMLEASEVLGLHNDVKTMTVAKRMLDHALAYGWDKELGGFWDGGYYFKGDTACSIVQPTKNWWAQAEALNILLIFSKLFPSGPYREFFDKQWRYVDTYILDHEKGDWFEGGIDKEPKFKNGPKSHMWKCTYHTGRALMNCITLLSDEPPSGSGPDWMEKKRSVEDFIAHWRNVAATTR